MNYTGLYEYTDSNRRRAVFRLQVHENVVIATEIKENPGMSVTNAAEVLAAQVCRDFGINPQESGVDRALWNRVLRRIRA